VKAVSFFKQRYPLLGILLAAIAGILLSSLLGSGWCLVAGVLCVSLLLLLFHKQGGICWAVTLAIFALLHLWNWNVSPARSLADDLIRESNGVSVQGVIIGEPRLSHSGLATFPLRLQEVRGLEGEKIITKAPVTVQVRWSGEVPSYGDRVVFQGTAVRPAPPRNPGEMDYRRWLARHGIYTRIEVDPSIPGTILSGGHGSALMAFAIRSRQRMEEILSIDLAGAAEVRGAIEGICLGVTEHAPEGFTDDFRFTGTMHLFAVSGLHVGMLAVILWFALKAVRIPRVWAVILTIPSLFFYVLVTGMKMGSIRSATMASILLIGISLFRRSPLLNTLAAAAFLQLALDTNNLFSAGWQFSYSVVFAIIVVAPGIESWLIRFHEPDPFLPAKLITTRERWGFRAWHHVAGLAAVSASAWIGAILPTLAYFHLISFSAFGANLLAVPLAFLVISLGALSLVTGMFSSWIAGAFNNANWLITKLLLLIVQGSAMMPGGHWFVGPAAPASPTMTMLDLHGSSCSIIRDGSEFILINAGKKRDAGATILPCLESMGANSIRSCLITKVDASHLGGLPVLSKELHVSDVLVASPTHGSAMGKSLLSSLKSRLVFPSKLISLSRRVSAEVLKTGDDAFPVIRIMIDDSRILILPSADQETISSLSGLSDDSLHADVLVLPLGDGEFSSSMALIARVTPMTVITPVSPLKRHGVPSREWEKLLSGKGIALFRQDETGALIIQPSSLHTLVTPFVDSLNLNP
jgi:ComEC/Rec2-related protein